MLMFGEIRHSPHIQIPYTISCRVETRYNQLQMAIPFLDFALADLFDFSLTPSVRRVIKIVVDKLGSARLYLKK